MYRLPPTPRTSTLFTAAMLAVSALWIGTSVGPEASSTGAETPTHVSAVSAPANVPPAAKRAPGASRSAGILTLDWGDIDATHGAWRGNYLVLEPWEAARIPALKAKNPRLKVLMYKNVAAVRKDTHESGVSSTGLTYREAQAGGWLLTDRGGRVVQWSDWSGLYPTNIRDPRYQDRWAGNVLRELRRGDWDGVMMDDTLTYLSHPTVGNRTPTQIPNNQAMYDATEQFLSRVAGRIKSSGFMAVPNLTVEWNTWRSVVSDWTRYVSGWENEYFVKWGLDRQGARFVGADWRWKVDLASWLAARNVPLLAITYSNRSDRAAQIYHRATWLLTWNGRTGSSVFVPDEPDVNHWTRPATVDLGLPTRARRTVGATGVWRRTYSRGTVLVNPTRRAVTVRVGPGHRTLAGRQVNHVRVAPLAGALLRRG